MLRLDLWPWWWLLGICNVMLMSGIFLDETDDFSVSFSII